MPVLWAAISILPVFGHGAAGCSAGPPLVALLVDLACRLAKAQAWSSGEA